VSLGTLAVPHAATATRAGGNPGELVAELGIASLLAYRSATARTR